MKVSIHDRQKDLLIDKRPLHNLVEAVLSLHKVKTDHFILHFVTVKRICQLHEQFFNDPSPTDCISFPIDPQGSCTPRILGEVFVCPKTAVDYCLSKQSEPYEELALYIVHGLLHCLGFDDIDPKDRQKMRRAERNAMKILKEAGIYLKPSIEKACI